MRWVAITMFCGAVASAQSTNSKPPTTDAAKIADALRAGPEFITKNATILDWPSTPGGEFRVLRQGSGDWSCLPGFPGSPHDEPGCFDPVFLKWTREGLAGRKATIDRVGISYMYAGAWIPNKSGNANAQKEFHVGPHIMIITPHQDELQALNRDGSNGMPYVTHLPNQTDLFLVVPVRDWNSNGMKRE